MGNRRTPRKTRKNPVWPTINTPLESSGFEPETLVGTAARSSHATTGTATFIGTKIWFQLTECELVRIPWGKEFLHGFRALYETCVYPASYEKWGVTIGSGLLLRILALQLGNRCSNHLSPHHSLRTCETLRPTAGWVDAPNSLGYMYFWQPSWFNSTMSD